MCNATAQTGHEVLSRPFGPLDLVPTSAKRSAGILEDAARQPMSSPFNVPPLSGIGEPIAPRRCGCHYRELIDLRVPAAGDRAPVSPA